MVPITVLHIMPRLAFGGMEVAAFRVINSLPVMKHILCFLYSKKPQVEMLGRLNNKQIISYSLGKKSGIDVSLFRKMAWICRTNKVDILHCRNFASTFYAGMARLYGSRARLIADVRGVEEEKRKLLGYEGMAKLGLIDRVVVVSADLRHRMIKGGIRASRIINIPNGIDFDPFLEETDRKLLLEQFGIASGSTVIGTVGRLEKIKNFELLIRVFEKILKRNEKVALIFVGDGSERARLEGLVETCGIQGSVRFLGYRSDVPKVLKVFDIFVSSSMSEGMSNGILEAMAAGIPVVASKVGGTPELVEHEKNGLLFTSCSVDEMCEMLDIAIKSPALRARYGRNGVEKVREHYSIEATATKYSKLYHSLLGKEAL